MTNAEKITDYLRNNKGKYCDDCLSYLLHIKFRQTVNSECRFLDQQNKITRKRDQCLRCSEIKLVNSIENNAETKVINNEVDIALKQTEKRIAPVEFEKRVSNYLQRELNMNFIEKPLLVGESKSHKFDLVSDDNSVIVECKSYKWTQGQNTPSAKISTAVEAAFYLSRIKAQRKIIAFQDDFNNKGESLVEVFVRRYDDLLDDIEIWSYIVGETPDKDQIITMRNPKDSWYEKLYS